MSIFPSRKNPVAEKIHRGKDPSRKRSILEEIHPGKDGSWKRSILEKIHPGKDPSWKRSIARNVNSKLPSNLYHHFLNGDKIGAINTLHIPSAPKVIISIITDSLK